jgi:hypothetical protein
MGELGERLCEEEHEAMRAEAYERLRRHIIVDMMPVSDADRAMFANMGIEW